MVVMIQVVSLIGADFIQEVMAWRVLARERWKCRPQNAGWIATGRSYTARKSGGWRGD